MDGIGPAKAMIVPRGPMGGSKAPTTLVADVPGEGMAGGAWEVAYRVTSADGHPVQGTLSFTVRPPANGTTEIAINLAADNATAEPLAELGATPGTLNDQVAAQR